MNNKNISSEIIVGLQILDLEHPSFCELVKILDGRISRNEVGMSLDKLLDLGLIKENWIKRDGTWRREILLTKDSKIFFEDIHNKVIKE
jgi:DNA-binding transcriptional ArsR family regulator